MNVILFGDDTFTEEFRRGLEMPPGSGIVATALDSISAYDVLNETEADLVIVGFADALTLALEWADLFRDMKFIAVKDKKTIAECKQAAGRINPVILKSRTEVRNEMLKIIAAKEKISGNFSSRERLDPEEISDSKERHEKRTEFHTLPQIVAAVFGPKGGPGKTAIAVNFSFLINDKCREKKENYRAILVDADLSCGNHSAAWLGFDKTRVSLKDWNELEEDASWEQVESLLMRHPTGLYYLPAPTQPLDAEEITGETMEKVLTILKRHFDAIVIDMNDDTKEDANKATMHLVNKVIFVVQPEVPTIRSARIFTREQAARLKLDLNKFYLAINKMNNLDNSFTSADIVKKIGLPDPVVLDYDINVTKMLNNKPGKPFVLSEPESGFSRGIYKLGKKFTGSEIFNFKVNDNVIKHFIKSLGFLKGVLHSVGIKVGYKETV